MRPRRLSGLKPPWVRYALLAHMLMQILCGCDYARMYDDYAFDTYETKMPEMPRHTIPVSGGIETLRRADLSKLHNPLPPTRETVEIGALKYGYYCVHCHGSNGLGKATVGQSFAPLPTNLQSPYVQSQTDGELFYKISLGYRRHPPMGATVMAEDRWAIIGFIRALDDVEK